MDRKYKRIGEGRRPAGADITDLVDKNRNQHFSISYKRLKPGDGIERKTPAFTGHRSKKPVTLPKLKFLD